MNDLNSIILFVQKYGVEVFVFGLFTCLIVQVLKKFLTEKHKNLTGILPFLIGTLIYFLYSALFLYSFNFYVIFSKGIQAGGIATLFYQFLKQLSLNKGNIKKAVEDLLKGIISTKTISKVVTLITKEYSTEISEEELNLLITDILKQHTEMPEDVLQAVAKLIWQTIANKHK